MALNSYRISETLHHSRRFLLYKAERISDGRQVLIKTQDPALITDKNLTDSLKTEAETALLLEHQSIRKGLGCFKEGLSVYMVAEYAAGESLAERILTHTPQLEQALSWAKDILNALIYLDAKGITDGSLNPYNVIVAYDDSLKLIGYGKKREAWKHSEGNFKYPLPILYVAPEIFRTANHHKNSDIYSWAVLVYQAICGTLPWRLDSFGSPEEQKQQSLSRAILMPDNQLMPDWLYSILLACLKTDPYERVASAAELLNLLRSEAPDLNWADSLDIEDSDEAIIETLPQAPVDEQTAEPVQMPDAEVTHELEASVEPEADEAIVISEFTAPEPDPELLNRLLRNAEESVAFEAVFAASEPLERNTCSEPVFDITDDEPAHPAPKEENEPPLEPMEHVFEEPRETALEASSEAEAPIQIEPPEDDETARQENIEEHPEKPLRVQIPKPETQDQVYRVPEQDKKDLSGMQKAFRWLMVISLIILAYIAIQYFFLQERPEFAIAEPEVEVDDILVPELRENYPLEMVLVPADTLIMGSISPEAKDDEFPLLTVPIRQFMISATEVTQSQWNMVFATNPSLFRGDDLPIDNVSFYDVIEYCNAKSLKDGLTPAYDYYGTEIVCDFEANGYRLPTEAEWELAAKAGQGKNFLRFSGSDDPDEVAWYSANSNARSHEVGSKTPNALGIYDMSGNLYEWVWNWYTPYSHRISNLYSGPENGTDKVIRGGSWYHNEALMRNTARSYSKPFVKNGYTGFRVVRSR